MMVVITGVGNRGWEWWCEKERKLYDSTKNLDYFVFTTKLPPRVYSQPHTFLTGPVPLFIQKKILVVALGGQSVIPSLLLICNRNFMLGMGLPYLKVVPSCPLSTTIAIELEPSGLRRPY